MDQTVLTNKKGMTLVEVMFALVILLIASLALMKTALLGISMNVQNALRDEAVNVAEQRMNEVKSQPFDTIATGAEPAVSRDFRGFTVTYTPTRTVADINVNSKQISISVAWSYRGQAYSHSITTILRKQ